MAAAGGGWSSLPAELLGQIFGSLSADADHVHVRQVCAHWRASIPPLVACRPWIVAGREPWRGAGPIGDHSFWLPHGGRRVYSCAPAGFPHCCGTPHGWLALMDDLKSPKRFILWEPVSKAEILLPGLPAVAQVFLSGDPLGSPDWIAAAVQSTSRSDVDALQRQLFFWRPGEGAWIVQHGQKTCRIDSAVFHRRRLYIADKAWNLSAYDLEAFPPKRVWASYFHPAVNPPGAQIGLRYGLRAVHLVSCNGELLVVMLRWGRHPTLAEVHKPSWMGASLRELGERVTDLGEYSLFLGRGDALALSAKQFPSIRRNCVYFAEHDKNKHEHWVVVFDLGSNSCEQIPYPESHSEDAHNGDCNLWMTYSWFLARRPVLNQ